MRRRTRLPPPSCDVLAAVICACLSLLLPALLVPGCVSYTPEPLVPADELAALRHTSFADVIAEHAAPGTRTAGVTPAFDLTDGLSEDELIAVALTLNPDLHARRLEIGAAEALLIGAGVLPNPEVGVSWRTGIGGADGHSLDADLLMDILQPWLRSARQAIAMAHFETVQAEIVAEEWRLVRKTRIALLDVRSAVQIAAMLDDAVGIRAHMLDLAEKSRAAGEGTDLDVSSAELELAEMQRDQRFAQADVDIAGLQLNAVLGLPPDYRLHLTDENTRSTVTVFDALSNDELEQRLFSGRHELRALEAAYQRSELELELAVQRQFPSLQLGLGLEREAGGDSFLGPAIGLEFPLFDRNQAEIAEKTVARDRARAEYVATLHRLRADAYDARARLGTARREIEAQERDVLPKVRRNQDLIEGAFQLGEVGVLDWVTAQQRALRAQRTYLETLLRYQRSVIEIEAATGMPLVAPVVLPTRDGTQTRGPGDE